MITILSSYYHHQSHHMQSINPIICHIYHLYHHGSMPFIYDYPLYISLSYIEYYSNIFEYHLIIQLCSTYSIWSTFLCHEMRIQYIIDDKPIDDHYPIIYHWSPLITILYIYIYITVQTPFNHHLITNHTIIYHNNENPLNVYIQ